MTLSDLTGIFGAAAASEAVRDRRRKWLRRLPTSHSRCALSLKAKIAVGVEHEQHLRNPYARQLRRLIACGSGTSGPSFRGR